MKKKTILYVAAWLLALVACVGLLDGAMRRDDGARKYDAFFGDELGFDVFLMGTSRMFDSVSPVELWRDYGITSYNLANSSEPLDVTRWVLDLAMDVHMPKVAVIDVYYVTHSVDESWTYPYRHMFLDELPLSMTLKKFEAVRATLPRSEWMEFMFPFSLYHGRWEEILSGNVERQVDCESFTMGGELRFGRYEKTFERVQEISGEEQPGYQALREIAALCRERGVTPVFVMVPAPIDAREQIAVNGVAKIAHEEGVVFLNMLDEDVIDYAADCYDEVGHLNPDGNAKTTAWLGAWLAEHFDFEDKRGDERYGYWNEHVRDYEAYRAANWP